MCLIAVTLIVGFVTDIPEIPYIPEAYKKSFANLPAQLARLEQLGLRATQIVHIENKSIPGASPGYYIVFSEPVGGSRGSNVSTFQKCFEDLLEVHTCHIAEETITTSTAYRS
jgi:hypothetical protein